MAQDHVIPLNKGGKDEVTNLQLLHRHCHDSKTALDQKPRGTDDNSQLNEEPDEGKLSCPVLKPSGRGDPVAWAAHFSP